MDEEKNVGNEEIKTGLKLSDTAAYDVFDLKDDEHQGSQGTYLLTHNNESGDTSPDSPVHSEGQPENSGKSGKKEPRKGSGRALAFILGFVLCLAVMFILTDVCGLGRFLTKEEYEKYISFNEKYGKYAEIMELIENDPIAEHSATEINDAKLKEIVESTGDPYAEYFTAEEYAEFKKQYFGDYVGIGVGVTEEDGAVVIKSVLEDSPAEEIGLQKEDIIEAVDGKKPEGVDDAIEMIGGEAGTRVDLTIRRGDETLELTATRARIEETSVAYAEYEEEGNKDTDIGYIAITTFRKGTSKEFENAVKDLEGEGCDRFIIDLRDNGGGLTDESIDVADYLLPECRIMSETTKNGKETIYNSKASSAGIDYVLLVNENTASASEILTAAVQDNKGGAVIGSKTYGKGVTQITHQFKDGSSIKITSTEYFRPNGGKVDGVGITPDVEATDDDILEKALEELGK